MRRTTRIFLASYAVMFVFSFLGFRRLENAGLTDSIGSWYTVYCAALSSLPVALIFTLIYEMLLRQWHPGRR
jgi:hypothetical protein